MQAHVTAILLGVGDLDRSKRFYGEGLGWEVKDDYGVSVFYESDGSSLVGFYRREGLAEQAGATILKPAGALPWGGYGGTFADPDGYVWSVAHSARGADQHYAE